MFSKFFDMFRNWKSYSRYLIVGVIVFFLGILWHFPLERFGSVITNTIQKETGYLVQFEKLSLTLPIGIHAQNVLIQSSPSSGQAIMLQLDHLTLRPSIFALLTYPFRKAVGFSYKALRGKEIWAGSANFGKENTSVDIAAKNFEWTGSFPLDQNPMFAGKTLGIQTTVNIDVTLRGKTIAIQQGNLSEAEGKIELHSKKTDVNAPMVNQVSFSNVTFESTLKKGTLEVKKIGLTSPTLTAEAKGNINVAPFFPNSQMTLEGKIKADEKDPNMVALVQLFGSLYNIQPGSDGTLALKINGLLNSPERLSITGF